MKIYYKDYDGQSQSGEVLAVYSPFRYQVQVENFGYREQAEKTVVEWSEAEECFKETF